MRLLLNIIIICICLISCNSEQNSQHNNISEHSRLITLKGETMGTTYLIKYFGHENFNKEIDSLLIELNNSVSTYIPTSTISKINHSEHGGYTDQHFNKNFFEAKKIYEATNGYFNPAVMPLVNYYGFGYEKQNLSEIDSLKVKGLKELTNFDQFKFTKKGITKEKAGAELDFSALAKGYGVDEVGRYLKSKKIISYLVEIGGETLAFGKKGNGELWTVGIRKPTLENDGNKFVYQAIQLNNEAMATSGNYENFKVLDDKKTIAHTINPITGFPQPLEDEILSSTVIAPTCIKADGFATAFKVMGLQKSKKILERENDLKVFFIFKSEKGTLASWSNIEL